MEHRGGGVEEKGRTNVSQKYKESGGMGKGKWRRKMRRNGTIGGGGGLQYFFNVCKKTSAATF